MDQYVERIKESEQKEGFAPPSHDPGTKRGEYFLWVVLFVGSMSLVLVLLSVTEGWFGGTPIGQPVM